MSTTPELLDAVARDVAAVREKLITAKRDLPRQGPAGGPWTLVDESIARLEGVLVVLSQKTAGAGS